MGKTGIKGILEEFEAQVVKVNFPTSEDYDLLRDILGEETEAQWDTKRSKILAIRFNNLEKLQMALDYAESTIVEALKEGDLEKLKIAFASVLRVKEDVKWQTEKEPGSS